MPVKEDIVLFAEFLAQLAIARWKAIALWLRVLSSPPSLKTTQKQSGRGAKRFVTQWKVFVTKDIGELDRENARSFQGHE